MNLQELFEKETENLSPREKSVLELVFGIDKGIPRTVEDVAQIIGADSKDISELEHSGLLKVKENSKKICKQYPYTNLLNKIFENEIFIYIDDTGELKKELDEILNNNFSGKEIQILDLYFGLTDGKPKTLRSVGQEVGLSGERIRQIIDVAIIKLKKYNNPLKKYLFKEQLLVMWEEKQKKIREERVRKPLPNIDDELLNFDK